MWLSFNKALLHSKLNTRYEVNKQKTENLSAICVMLSNHLTGKFMWDSKCACVSSTFECLIKNLKGEKIHNVPFDGH